MIGRRATVGLALLCALLFSAIAVQSASAAAATKTTLFTCVKQPVAATGTFDDEHCDNDNINTKGDYEHKALEAATGSTTEVVISNDTTGTSSTQTLKGNPFSVKTQIDCTTLEGTGSVGNTEPKALEHKISGKGELKYKNCTVKEPAKCTVKEPIVVNIGFAEGVEGIEGPKGEEKAMGIEYKPENDEVKKEPRPFTEITTEGPECALKGKIFPVAGTVIGTSGPKGEGAQTNKWSGATSIYTAAMTSKTLTAGGKAGEYIGNTTIRMKEKPETKPNPIVATTVT